MTKLSARLDKLEAVNTVERLITVAVDCAEDIAPLLARHGVDLRPGDLLVRIPAGGRPATLIQLGGEVYAAGHTLEAKLNPPTEPYATPPTAR